MIVLKHVSKVYSGRAVINDVSLTIHPGELVCIAGPSGAGKSTLLNLISGTSRATAGSVLFDGVDLNAVPPIALRIMKKRIGVVFQDYKLFPARTVAENIAFPLEVCGLPEQIIREHVNKIIEKFQLKKVANSFPMRLSGGELARTAIARAVIHRPYVLLADEPTGNLDPVQSAKTLRLFKKINEEGTTVILATHDMELVKKLKGRIVLLDDGKKVMDRRPKPKKGGDTIPEAPAEEETAVPNVKPEAREGKRRIRITALHSS